MRWTATLRQPTSAQRFARPARASRGSCSTCGIVGMTDGVRRRRRRRAPCTRPSPSTRPIPHVPTGWKKPFTADPDVRLPRRPPRPAGPRARRSGRSARSPRVAGSACTALDEGSRRRARRRRKPWSIASGSAGSWREQRHAPARLGLHREDGGADLPARVERREEGRADPRRGGRSPAPCRSGRPAAKRIVTSWRRPVGSHPNPTPT